ncbi:hypothetical protein LCGC14_2149530, partial [marine sediment metagenome]
PAEGEIHALGPAPQGVWAGHPDTLAAWSGGAWVFIAPRDGWRAWGRAEQALYLRRGGVWADIGGLIALENVAGVGIGTQSDAVNRLTVAAPATLLSHEGGGHQLKINKATPGDTASLLYQTGFSGRAEIGLAGTDELAIKVSADGTQFTEALRVPGDTGRPVLPQGATVEGSVTGTAVTQTPTDATEGRLLKVGDFGLGTPAGQAPPIAVLNTATTPGQYAYGAATANAPSSQGGTLAVTRSSAQSLRQVAAAAGLDQSWQRTSQDDGTSWTGWAPVYGAGNILGVVASAAGQPTGAVIERGSNSNGDYVRFADGTQICHVTEGGAVDCDTPAGALFTTSSEMTWTFPAQFMHSGAVTVFGAALVSNRFVNARRGASTYAVFRHYAPVSSPAQIETSLVAIGRWA